MEKKGGQVMDLSDVVGVVGVPDWMKEATVFGLPDDSDLGKLMNVANCDGKGTRSIFGEYKELHGDPKSRNNRLGALQHAYLYCAIEKAMSHEEFARYNKNVLIWKSDTVSEENVAKAAKKIARLEEKVLACPGKTDQEQKARAAVKQQVPAKRVKVIETGEKGSLQQGVVVNALYRVVLDESKAEVEYPLKDLVFLCDMCDEDAREGCSLCKSVYYCSVECQKKRWKQHKKTCSGFGDDKKKSSK